MSEQEATLDEFVESNEPPAGERIETPIGELPSDWAVEWLDDICSINPDGFSEDDWPDETFEYISLSDVSEGTIIQSKTTPIDDAPSRAQRRIKEGDVLVGTVRPKQVSHGFVTDEHDGKICSSGFGVLRSPANLNPLYLLQEVLSRRFFRQMEAYVAGSGYPAVKIGDLRKHRIAVPPLEEQRKIASVLYNVDEAIQKTEVIIKQIRRLRTGLLDELFTKGIKNDGFDTTYIGPREINHSQSWKVVNLEDMAKKITKGKTPTSYGFSYQSEGINFIKAESITEDGSFSSEDFEYISQEADKKLSGSRLQNQDILFSIAGALGKAAIVENKILPANTNQALALIRIDDQRVSPEYIRYYLETRIIQKYIQSISTMTAQSNLNLKQVSEFDVLLPPIEEQQEILRIIRSIEDRLNNEIEQQQKLKRLKQGLMQDLLSGDVRTYNTDIELVDDVLQHG